MPKDAWYYDDRGRRVGPVPFMKLKALIEEGQLPVSVRVWQKGMKRWVPANSLHRFAAENITVCAPGLQKEQFNEGRTALGSSSRRDNATEEQCAIDEFDKRLDEIMKTAPKYAGFWIRFAAKLFDVFVLFVVFFSVGIAINLCFGLPMIVDDKRMNPSDANWIVAAKMLSKIFDIIFGCLYEVLLTSNVRLQGTLGKLAVGVKVTDLEGGTVTLGVATGRYFAKVISTLLLFIGFIMAAFDKRKQALHDKLAGTYVVYRETASGE